jgi:hypothetical protein
MHMKKLRCSPQRAVLFTALTTLVALPASAQIAPNSPTTTWNALLYPPGSPVTPDPFSDQQTGSKESDIVGTASVASFFTRFYDGGTASLIDGQIAFRLRIAEQQNPPGFSGAAFVGIDGNGDGTLDLFVGVDNSGSFDHVGIWTAGNGLNVSPSTTSIQSPPAISYAETGLNYDWSPLNATIDPTTMTYDVDNGGNVDYFISFLVPFADLVSMFSTVGIQNVDENSIFSYVAATATQDNSLNQDLNGVNGGVNATNTWQQLGALTTPQSANGMTVVPEPSTYALLLLGGGLLLLLKRRR